MSNIIGFSKAAFGNEKISMSNQGTDCFLELLEMAAAEEEMTDSQRKLIGFFERSQGGKPGSSRNCFFSCR